MAGMLKLTGDRIIISGLGSDESEAFVYFDVENPEHPVGWALDTGAAPQDAVAEALARAQRVIAAFTPKPAKPKPKK